MGNQTSLILPTRYPWVASVLKRSGSTVESAAEGVLELNLGKDLADLLGRNRIKITFRKRSARIDGVDLASPGSWFHDQLIRYSRQRGAVAHGFLPVKKDLARESLVRVRRPGLVRLDALKERRYGNILVFAFHLYYYSEPPEESIAHVTYDCDRSRADKRPLQNLLSRTAGVEPLESFSLGKRPKVREAYQTAWAAIQDRVEQKVHAIEQDGKALLDDRIATVERYYRQLLAEEKRHQKTRLSRKGHVESQEKIDLLKLEWERRVKEETDRLRPQVIANLSQIARIRPPLERWGCTIQKKGREVQREVWVDVARGETWEAPRKVVQRTR